MRGERQRPQMTSRSSRHLRRFLLAAIAAIPLVSLAAVSPVSAATARSDISVTIVADRAGVMTGQQITYTATMTNRGPDDASFVDASFTWPSQLDIVSMSCDLGISPDGPACEYSSLKAGQSVVSVLVATPHPGGHPGNRQIRVGARVLFENSCSYDPNCTFDPNSRNNAASVRTKLT
jgi:uncharacterized repeat protein (TIGR01451 family)